MKATELIGQWSIRSKPREIHPEQKGYWDFSYMDEPIFVVDVGEKYIFYKVKPLPKKFYKTELEYLSAKDFLHCALVSTSLNGWEKFDETKMEFYLKRISECNEFYEKTYPEKIKVFRRSF